MRTLAYLIWKPWYNARGLYWRDVAAPVRPRPARPAPKPWPQPGDYLD